MSLKLTITAIGGVLSMATISPQTAMAKHYHHDDYTQERDANGHYYRDRASYDRDHRYQRCSGGNGAVGTVAGGVGGALLGSAVGGGTLGTIGGGIGGALLGRTLDKNNTRSKHGC